jgi:hypothetical protein
LVDAFGLDLEFPDDPRVGPVAFETTGGDLFLPVRVTPAPDEDEGATYLLRVAPLGMTDAAGPELTLGRWESEWTDLTRPSRSEGLLPVQTGIQQVGRPAPILPPTYFCPEKQCWIVSICPSCTGPAPAGDRSAAPRCAICGSPRPEGAEGAPAPGPLEGLAILASGEEAGSGQGEHGYRLPCLDCDRRSTCFPSTGPSEGGGAAAEILVPLSSLPWGGAVVHSAHLPLEPGLRLLEGEPWSRVREGVDQVPPSLVAEAERRFGVGQSFFIGPGDTDAFACESLLLRLEWLRQLLLGARTLAVDGAHPHLAIAPERIRVSLGTPDGPVPLLWCSAAHLLDTSPGFRSDGADEPPRFDLPDDRSPLYAPAGCTGGGGGAIEGICLPRGGSSVDFLPTAQFSSIPGEGDRVEILLPTSDPAAVGKILARVQIAFAEVCRLEMDDPRMSAEEATAELAKHAGSSGFRIRVSRDHSLVDDLFALGTIWFGSLIRQPFEWDNVAKLRDEMIAAAGVDRPEDGTDGAGARALEVMENSGLLCIQMSGDSVRSDETGDGAAPRGVDRGLMSRSLALGLRMCAVLPDGYPGQDHQPVSVEQRAQAYDLILAQVRELQRELRSRLFSSREEARVDALDALGAYALERLRKAREQ